MKILIIIIYSISALSCLDLYKVWKKNMPSNYDIKDGIRLWIVSAIVFVPLLNTYVGCSWWLSILSKGREKTEKSLLEEMSKPIE